MTDVIEPLGLLEIFCDGFEQHERQGHNMICLAVRNMKGVKVAVARLIFPVEAVAPAIEEARQAVADDRPSPHGLMLSSCTSKPN